MFNFTMKRQRTLFAFLSVGNGKNSRMETVTGKVILDVASVWFASNAGKSVPWTSHLTVRRLQKTGVAKLTNITCGDRKLHLVTKCSTFRSKVFKIYFRRRFERILDKKNPSRTWMKTNMQRISFGFETNDSVVTLHISTARIPRKWLLSIFLWL